MKLGQRGEALIKARETLRMIAYRPTAHDVPTIGWGHTRGVRLGDIATEEQAEAWFHEDTAQAIAAVSAIGAPMTQGMFDALVSLVFNVGSLAVTQGSSIGDALRQGDIFAAWTAFPAWHYQNHKPLLGLARRRTEEMALFLEDGLPEGSSFAKSGGREGYETVG